MSAKRRNPRNSYIDPTIAPEAPVQAEEIKPWEGETRIVGKGVPRVDAYEQVSGTAQFTHDVLFPDLLYLAVLRSPHPHAMVKRVDTSAAEKMPGVVAVLTGDSPGADIPWPYIPWMMTAPKQTMLFDKHCRYEGDEVAAVAAETPHQAWDAVEAIKVDYEILPFVLDRQSALQPDASKLYESGNDVSRPVNYTRGDIEAGFADADIVLEETFTTSVQVHTTMETHGSVVKWDGDKLTIWESTQGVFESVMRTVSEAPRISLNNVRAICR